MSKVNDRSLVQSYRSLLKNNHEADVKVFDCSGHEKSEISQASQFVRGPNPSQKLAMIDQRHSTKASSGALAFTSKIYTS